MYIIEDLHAVYWKEWGGLGNMSSPMLSPGSIHHYLRERLDDINLLATKSGVAGKVSLTDKLLREMSWFRCVFD
jgi:hypothetical protein